MKRLSALLAAFVLLALASPCFARTTFPAHLDDTIVVKLPNQATMTLFVKNKQQLRELRAYKLDSLMLLLDTYISQAEAAGKNSKSEQVTMEFYPAKDRPGKQVPEQIRITMRNDASTRSNGDKVEVNMGRVFGVKVEENADGKGGDRVDIHLGSTAKDDSVAAAKRKAKKEAYKNRAVHNNFTIDLGLNTLVGAKAPQNQLEPDLKPIGSRYLSLNWHYDIRVGKPGSPFHLLTGPELAFNNYMLDDNSRFINTNGVTTLVSETDLSLDKSKLAVTMLNLPLMATLQFKGNNDKDGFRIGAGGFIGYRLGSHTKIKYSEDGRTRKDKDRGSYNLTDFQYGVQGLIGIRSLELFGKYNLNDLFKNDLGIQAQALSFGITLLH
ncbi:outer membrane beta-barrel protein [Hymenobacter sp. YC55]|uniref:outer membrane beta-barrel protein n=1 Tax=Hymenobacter sp. YC55 TaxID=3034019 RepID=UPI0023F8EACA|nr:outer membrane beta-barrel protein [Hymenobacter sp. YC55]MDF7811671.1 outer membrane beta-barrel protein [Hymenobacter sp. YC55]